MDNATHLQHALHKKERFEKMYFHTRTMLFHYVRKFVPLGEQGVEDVVQECYMRLWKNMDKITEDDDILPLLRTYAINYSITQLRKHAKEKQRVRLYTDQQEMQIDTRDELHFKFALSEFKQALETLPPQQKLVYRLIREKGLSHKEVSMQLGISPKTVERHINEAMRSLRSHMTAEKLVFALLMLKINGIL